MNPTSFMLEPTKSCQERLCVYTPATEEVGVLQVIEKTKSTSKKAKVRRWAVVAVREDNVGWKTFKLTKPKGKDQEVYHVCVKPGADPNECECKGFAKAGMCVHETALAELVDRGAAPTQPSRAATAPAQSG